MIGGNLEIRYEFPEIAKWERGLGDANTDDAVTSELTNLAVCGSDSYRRCE